MLLLPKSVREELFLAVSRGYPHETCGVLVGVPDGENSRVIRSVEARNLNEERAHDRFQLDPRDFNSADTAARADGFDIIGVWHSHPDHPAKPSATDLERAWEGWSYVIISVSKDGPQELRSWRLAGKAFDEEQVTYEES